MFLLKWLKMFEDVLKDVSREVISMISSEDGAPPAEEDLWASECPKKSKDWARRLENRLTRWCSMHFDAFQAFVRFFSGDVDAAKGLESWATPYALSIYGQERAKASVRITLVEYRIISFNGIESKI